jgi:GrpB-like predicted nucleotidyltransferase (UPF0157 family)
LSICTSWRQLAGESGQKRCRYSPDWPARFDVWRDRLATALGSAAVRIDHVGSTSVPRMAAKPVIDIQGQCA